MMVGTSGGTHRRQLGGLVGQEGQVDGWVG